MAAAKPAPSAKDKAQEVHDTTLDKIKSVAATATAEETATFNEIVALAKAGKCASKVFSLTPAVQALLFIKCNGHNRAWRNTGPKSATEYARRMSSGQWKWNGESISFYVTALLSDGQHRLSGGALSDYTLVTPIVFGVALNASDTIDDGLARHGSDHVTMRGVKDGKKKQSIIATAGAYLGKAGIPFDTLKSEAEIAAAIEAHNDTLSKSLEFAALSERNCATPLLSITEAARIAFVMLFGNWPHEKIAYVLRRLQSGTSLDTEGGEKSPLFIATEIIAAKVKGKSLAAVKQVGLVINAALMIERGEKASQRVMRAEAEKEIPNPAFPSADLQQAA
jgi:hypothetical protein